jgi:hypothetical protein
LPVAVDIEPPHHPPPDYRLFQDSRSHDPTAPSVLARQANTEG